MGVAKALKLAFAEALKDLDAAAAEVATTGGAVLDTGQLFDLYLYRAMATARADWNAPATPPTLSRPTTGGRGPSMTICARPRSVPSEPSTRGSCRRRCWPTSVAPSRRFAAARAAR